MNFFNAEKNSKTDKSFPLRLLFWVGQHELTVLLSFALIIGGIWLTAVLADGVTDGVTQQADLNILMALRDGGDSNNPLGPPWIEEMMRDFTALGGTGILTLIVLAVTLFYMIQGRYKEMLILVTAVIGAFIFSYFLKSIFDRPRPGFIPPGAHIYTASFPSGHALLAATTYLTLGIIVAQLTPHTRLKAFALLLALFIMILVGFTRMYLGVHWPTDVLAGWIIGSVWAIFCWLVVRWLRHRGYVRPLRFYS
jgi:undecaprenyl-diphosphatase